MTAAAPASSRKGALTSIAVAMLQTQGFSALGLRDIAAAAGMRAASLYSHFTSKDELARLAMSLYAQQQAAEMATLDAAPTGAARLHAYLAMIARNLLDNDRLCLGLMLAVERNALPDDVIREVRSFAGQNVVWLASSWDIGRADGSVRSHLDGVTAAPVLFSAIEGIVAFALLEPEQAATFRDQASTLLTALGVQRS